jgi:CRP-like cAMP-binding protein
MGRDEVRTKPPAFAPIEWDLLDLSGLLLPERRIGSGVILHEQNAFPEKLFFIKRGVAKLIYTTPNGAETMLGLRSTGWLAGAAQVLTNTVCTCTVRSITPCTLSELKPEYLVESLKKGGDLAYRVLCALAQEVVTSRELVKEVMCSSAEERLKAYIAESGELPSTWHTIDTSPMLKQSEIAQLLGVTPEHLSRLSRKKGASESG